MTINEIIKILQVYGFTYQKYKTKPKKGNML